MTLPMTPQPGALDGEHDLVQLLAPDGTRRHDPRYPLEVDHAQLEGWYRDLVLARRIDTEAFALQRHGELGLWPPALGQEAAQIGSGRALRGQDFVFPTYRQHGVAYCRGIDPALLLGVFRGTELGGWDPQEYRYALPQIIIGAQTLHATGYAMGLLLDGAVGHGDAERDTAAIAYLGDGATSQGDVAEAFVWAASYQAPVVFFCENNQYAISVPLERQTRVPIAQRAAGFGFEGVRVDGNDVLACYAVTRAALDAARQGFGPTLIEAVTYRVGAHTTSDDPTRYREDAETEAWRAKDPIDRVRIHLQREGSDAAFFASVEAEADQLGAHLREVCGRLPEPDLVGLFDHVYTDVPEELARQRDDAIAWQATDEGGDR
ncbi:pyruvate dehydrogenase (acetyl-transferring) E1 component subunit alpha [Aeromicrobium sp. YIM 150415]|uniref:pyruvate dehydrogenase (acetyl-transferring) E1 component subunit alpha n=1 Tax=Aeromicrobium sp. YIM 150415 TaxID=2803912 RepID=UPI001963E34A|nr:pyruvate dehydrogenase (acetyl-transferring) E1 component subunit alpha [Aeromicrobium sp. YIM 150415]MBM9462452.1 pyruvate dehydrogenase (acetyl-transferring) E1 component subunit alpha [Aeromicrobium sp. YIM 150415]